MSSNACPVEAFLLKKTCNDNVYRVMSHICNRHEFGSFYINVFVMFYICMLHICNKIIFSYMFLK